MPVLTAIFQKLQHTFIQCFLILRKSRKEKANKTCKDRGNENLFHGVSSYGQIEIGVTVIISGYTSLRQFYDKVIRLNSIFCNSFSYRWFPTNIAARQIKRNQNRRKA